jgi:hypothetical protein
LTLRFATVPPAGGFAVAPGPEFRKERAKVGASLSHWLFERIAHKVEFCLLMQQRTRSAGKRLLKTYAKIAHCIKFMPKQAAGGP